MTMTDLPGRKFTKYQFALDTIEFEITEPDLVNIFKVALVALEYGVKEGHLARVLALSQEELDGLVTILNEIGIE